MSALSDRPRHIDTDTIAHYERVSADDTLIQSECRPDVRLPDAVRCLKRHTTITAARTILILNFSNLNINTIKIKEL